MKINNRAFTLVELLVVILIIGILAAIAVPQYQKAVAKTRTTSLFPLMRAIKNAQLLYKMEHDSYTDQWKDLIIEMPAGGTVVVDEEGDSWLEYNGFRCFLMYSQSTYHGGSSVYCQDLHGKAPKMELYYEDDFYHCWTAVDDDLSGKICKALGGTFYLSNNGGRNAWIVR